MIRDDITVITRDTTNSIEQNKEQQKKKQKRKEILKQLFNKFQDMYNTERKNQVLTLFIDKSLNDFINKEDLKSQDIEVLQQKIQKFYRQSNNPQGKDCSNLLLDNTGYQKDNINKQNNLTNSALKLRQSQQNSPSQKSDLKEQLYEINSQSMVQLPKIQTPAVTQNKQHINFQSDSLSVKSSTSRQAFYQSKNKSQDRDRKDEKKPREQQTSPLEQYFQIQQKKMATSFSSPKFNRMMNGKRMEEINEELDNMSNNSNKTPKSIIYMDKDNADEWAEIVKFDSKQYQKELNSKKLQNLKNQKQMWADLQAQIQEKNKRREQSENQEKFFNSLTTQQIQQLQEKEKESKDKQSNLNSKLKKDIDMQLKLKKLTLREQQQLEKQEGNELVGKFIQDKEQELEQKRKRKESEKNYMYKVWVESLNEKKQKKDLEKQQKMQDKQQFSQFGVILEKLDTRRNQELNKLHKHQEFVLNRWDKQSEEKNHLNLMKEIQIKELLQNQIRELELKEKEQNYQKQQRLHDLQNSNIHMNQVQKSIKQELIQKEQDVNKWQGQVWREQDEQYHQKQDQNKFKQNEQKQKIQNELITQINYLNKIKKQGAMSKEELLQNKHFLKKISSQQGLEDQQFNENADNILFKSIKSNEFKR